MDKPGCGIIQDLLLSYSDGLTAENITEMIEEHLKNCGVCAGKFEELKQNRELAESAENSRGKSFGEKLRGMKNYAIGIMIGLVAPVVLFVVIYLIASLVMLLEGLMYSYLL